MLSARPAAFVLALSVAAAAKAQAPTITMALPSAAAPGRAVDLTIRGSNLANPLSMWTSFPADVSFPADREQSASRATCRVTARPDAQVAVHALRFVTRGGVSGLHFLMVDDLPSVAEGGGNNSAKSAQSISAPVAVDGACESGVSDYYRVAAKKGQRVSVEVVAARLGSQLDPVVRLLDAAGRELAWCDDAPGAGPDCRFAHTVAADGDYVIELRDANYAGGADYRYRLRVGDFPLATVPFPLAAKRGTAAMFTFVGPDCAGILPVTLAVPEPGGALPLGVRYARADHRGGSGFVAAALAERDESVESEPNDTPLAASHLIVPSAVSGRLESAGERDVYQFPAKKNQRLVFRARTRSLGSPCDVLLQAYRPDGSKLAESKVEGATEGTLDATFPEDGTYRLVVEDIARAGGPDLAYRVEVEPYRPGYSLSVETDTVQAKPGGTFELKVTCTRRDYTSSVSLSLAGLRAESLEGATIGVGKNETTLKVKLPPDLKPGSLVHFGVVGTARFGDAEIVTPASTLPALRKQFPRLLYPPELTDGMLALGVREP